MIEGLLFSLHNIANRLLPLSASGDPGGILVRPGVTPVPVDVVAEAAEAIAMAPPPAEPAGGMWIMIVYAALFIVAIYFMMFRGPRRREKKMKEMQASIRTGDNVVVSGGMFGKVADIGDDCFVVEFGQNRGIRIPVLKSDVLGVREPKLTPPPKEAAE